MKLNPEWIEHMPDMGSCVKTDKFIKAEADCPCGIKIRHQHCAGCGRVAIKGDWDAAGVDIGRIIIRGGKMVRFIPKNY